jgi:hypothetical protein
MAAKVVTVNPPKRRTRRTVKKNPTATPRRRRRRRNPTIHPALMATLGTLAGAATGAGADVAMRYTSLSPYMRGGILAGTGVAAGLALSFLDPSLGAGVGGGLGSVGVAEIVLQATSPSPETQDAALAQVRAELGRVTAHLGALPGMHTTYPALQAADATNELVYVDEEDLIGIV